MRSDELMEVRFDLRVLLTGSQFRPDFIIWQTEEDVQLLMIGCEMVVERERGERCGRQGEERENPNSNSKTLFQKDCSLGSVKT